MASGGTLDLNVGKLECSSNGNGVEVEAATADAVRRAPPHQLQFNRERATNIDRARRSISTEARKANLVDSITSFSTIPKKYSIKFDIQAIKLTQEADDEKENNRW